MKNKITEQTNFVCNCAGAEIIECRHRFRCDRNIRAVVKLEVKAFQKVRCKCRCHTSKTFKHLDTCCDNGFIQVPTTLAKQGII